MMKRYTFTFAAIYNDFLVLHILKVAKVSERQAMNQEAYILFYEQGSHDQSAATADNVNILYCMPMFCVYLCPS